MPSFELVSHHLCPYVQRVAIALSEKEVPFTRTYINLGAKPGWFTAISPLGKVPLLRTENEVVFESAVICEYLEDTVPPRLHPQDALERARHRAWMEFASSVLNDIAGFYNATSEVALDTRATTIRAKWRGWRPVSLAGGTSQAPVSASWMPSSGRSSATSTPSTRSPTSASSMTFRRLQPGGQPSRGAVSHDYPERLRAFLLARNSCLSALMSPGPVPGLLRRAG